MAEKGGCRGLGDRDLVTRPEVTGGGGGWLTDRGTRLPIFHIDISGTWPRGTRADFVKWGRSVEMGTSPNGGPVAIAEPVTIRSRYG